jgi:dTDP-4-dehydrorhamnose reductase
MKIWIIGANGMLGQDLVAELRNYDYEIFATDREIDITNKNALEEFALSKEFDIIVNCAAYTAVDKAEDDTENAMALNGTAVKNIAEIAAKLNAKLIHISTDYVFDGTKDIALTEDMPTNPIGEYGRTKLVGEEAVKESAKKYFIIRTAWLYGKNGKNFVDTMLKLMNEKSELGVVADQWGPPTRTTDLADVIGAIIQSNSKNYGIYHYSGEGKTNWFLFASKIYELGKKFGLISNDCKINALNSEQYPTRAKRPQFSLLSKEKIKTEFFLEIPKWEDTLREYLKEKTNSQPVL